MNIEELKNRLHKMIDNIDDESSLNILMEEAAVYSSKEITDADELTAEQWQSIKTAQEQIKNGQYKTYEEVKQHFAQWLTK